MIKVFISKIQLVLSQTLRMLSIYSDSKTFSLLTLIARLYYCRILLFILLLFSLFHGTDFSQICGDSRLAVHHSVSRPP